MRIAWIWDWEPEYSQATVWEDGLAAAMRVLSERHEVKMFTVGRPTIIKHPYFDIYVTDDAVRDIAEFKPDVILHWGDMTRPNAVPLATLGVPQAILFAGGEALGYNWELFDHIFVESQVYKDVYEKAGASVSIAFGTNTDLFQPVSQNIAFDTIFPATFASWKRHDLYAMATEGLRSLAAGYMYEDHETECWQTCLDHGVTVLPSVSARVLHRLYAASRCCVIPSESSGGSQRTVLEAMAMNLPLVVSDSDKFDYLTDEVFVAERSVESIAAAIDKALTAKVNTRDHILENWSHITYANEIEKGLEALI